MKGIVTTTMTKRHATHFVHSFIDLLDNHKLLPAPDHFTPHITTFPVSVELIYQAFSAYIYDNHISIVIWRDPIPEAPSYHLPATREKRQLEHHQSIQTIQDFIQQTIDLESI